MKFVTPRKMVLRSDVLLIKVCFHMGQIDRLLKAHQNGLEQNSSSSLSDWAFVSLISVNKW